MEPTCGLHSTIMEGIQRQLNDIREDQEDQGAKLDKIIEMAQAHRETCATQCARLESLQREMKESKDDRKKIWSALDESRKYIWIAIGGAGVVSFFVPIIAHIILKYLGLG